LCFLAVIIALTFLFAHNQHIQMDSKDRKQLDLLGGRGREPHVEEVTPQLIRSIARKPTLLDAWNMACADSGLQDKEIYGPLKIDQSHWGKIAKNNASPPADHRFVQFMDVVGSEYPLIWLAEKRGYDFLSMRKHRSDLERQLEEKEKEIAAHKRTIQLLVEARGTV
jgi:hypothetical protein